MANARTAAVVASVGYNGSKEGGEVKAAETADKLSADAKPDHYRLELIPLLGDATLEGYFEIDLEVTAAWLSLSLYPSLFCPCCREKS